MSKFNIENNTNLDINNTSENNVNLNKNIIFARNDINLDIDIQNLENRIVDFLKTSKSEIAISIYRLNNKRISNTLKDLAKKGIKIRIIVSDKYLQECENIFSKSGKKISNIEVTHGNRNFLVHHNKFIVVDKTHVFIMTGNLDTHLGKSTDFIVHTKSNEICDNILNIFQYDWTNRSPKPIDRNLIFNNVGLYWSDGSVDKVENIYKQYYLDDLVNDEYFNNHGSSFEAYKYLVNNASKSIKIYMQLVNSFECLQYLCDAADKGVKIEAIFQSLGNYRLDAFIKGLLNRHGISVIFNKDHLPYVHAKVIIVDDKIAMLGSMNFSYASTHLNRELDIIIQGKEINKLIKKFDQDFKSLKSSIRNDKFKFHHPYIESINNQIL